MPQGEYKLEKRSCGLVRDKGREDSEGLFDLRTDFLPQMSLLETLLSCLPHGEGVRPEWGWSQMDGQFAVKHSWEEPSRGF